MKTNKLYPMLLFILAYALIVAAYYPALSAPLFSTDDDSLINIPQIQKGFELESIKSIFTPGNNPDYYPVRDISYIIDKSFWNADPSYSRLHQLSLFCLSSFLVFLILLELKVSIANSFAISLFWMVHPYHAETTMWLAARKDILAIFFALLSVLFTLKSLKNKKKFFIWCALFFYILSILSKASFTLLPIILVLSLFLGFNKIESRRFYFPILLSILFCFLSSLGQTWYYSQVNNMQHFIPFDTRILLSLTALGKMSAGWFYPSINIVDIHNQGDWLKQNYNFLYGGIIIWVIAISFLIYSIFQKKHDIIFGLCVLIFLYAPISGLFFPHNIFYSTRYLEAASLGLILILGKWTISHLNKHSPIFILLLLIPLLIGSFSEGKTWSKGTLVRKKAWEQVPNNLNLKALYLFDLVNEYKGATPYNEIIQIKNLIGKSLQDECLLTEAFLSNQNCNVFYYHAYYINRWNNNHQTAKVYYLNTLNLLSKIKPTPASYTRLQIEQMLYDGQIDKNFLKKWIESHPYLFAPELRTLYLITNCLLDKNAHEEKKFFINKNLLFESKLNEYINENLNHKIKDKVKICLK